MTPVQVVLLESEARRWSAIAMKLADAKEVEL
jgi:hypothetical protein